MRQYDDEDEQTASAVDFSDARLATVFFKPAAVSDSFFTAASTTRLRSRTGTISLGLYPRQRDAAAALQVLASQATPNDGVETDEDFA